jgi:putative ABC transport system permease protein
LTTILPFMGGPSRPVEIDGAESTAPPPTAYVVAISDGYLAALGLPMLHGRGFTATDSTNAVIVNQRFVDLYFAGRDPLGKVILFGGNKRHEIVGVVADARYRSVERAADPTFYLPLEQNDERWPFLAFTVWTEPPHHAKSAWRGPRTEGAAAKTAAAALLRSAVREADPQQPISRVRSIEEILSASMAQRRFNTWIVGLFAATALLLAAIGTYGVMAFAVASRTRELGVRAALGAQPSDLIRMVMRQGLLLTIIASALGLGTSMVMTRFMASMLFDVAPRDPLTFGLVALALASVAIAATLIPARRAMRLNPMVALRD